MYHAQSSVLDVLSAVMRIHARFVQLDILEIHVSAAPLDIMLMLRGPVIVAWMLMLSA